MLRRQKHVLSQSTTPFACTLIFEKTSFLPKFEGECGGSEGSREGGKCTHIRCNFGVHFC